MFTRRGFLRGVLGAIGGLLVGKLPATKSKTDLVLKVRLPDPDHLYYARSKSEWLELDNAVLKTARARMRAWADLQVANGAGRTGNATA